MTERRYLWKLLTSINFQIVPSTIKHFEISTINFPQAIWIIPQLCVQSWGGSLNDIHYVPWVCTLVHKVCTFVHKFVSTYIKYVRKYIPTCGISQETDNPENEKNTSMSDRTNLTIFLLHDATYLWVCLCTDSSRTCAPILVKLNSLYPYSWQIGFLTGTHKFITAFF